VQLGKSRLPRIGIIAVAGSAASTLAEGVTSPIAKLAEGLRKDGAVTWRELLAASAVLLGFGAVVLAGHIAQGGFSYDDWALSADEKYRLGGRGHLSPRLPQIPA
jgi:hypothetical protein